MWTDEENAALRYLWEMGTPVSLIQRHLPGRNKNAIIGKAKRLALSPHLDARIRAGNSRARVSLAPA